MPTNNEEAAAELRELLRDRDLTAAWLSRRIKRNEMWVSRKLNGISNMTINEYALLKSTICKVPKQFSLHEIQA